MARAPPKRTASAGSRPKAASSSNRSVTRKVEAQPRKVTSSSSRSTKKEGKAQLPKAVSFSTRSAKKEEKAQPATKTQSASSRSRGPSTRSSARKLRSTSARSAQASRTSGASESARKPTAKPPVKSAVAPPPPTASSKRDAKGKQGQHLKKRGDKKQKAMQAGANASMSNGAKDSKKASPRKRGKMSISSKAQAIGRPKAERRPLLAKPQRRTKSTATSGAKAAGRAKNEAVASRDGKAKSKQATGKEGKAQSKPVPEIKGNAKRKPVTAKEGKAKRKPKKLVPSVEIPVKSSRRGWYEDESDYMSDYNDTVGISLDDFYDNAPRLKLKLASVSGPSQSMSELLLHPQRVYQRSFGWQATDEGIELELDDGIRADCSIHVKIVVNQATRPTGFIQEGTSTTAALPSSDETLQAEGGDDVAMENGTLAPATRKEKSKTPSLEEEEEFINRPQASGKAKAPSMEEEEAFFNAPQSKGKEKAKATTMEEEEDFVNAPLQFGRAEMEENLANLESIAVETYGKQSKGANIEEHRQVQPATTGTDPAAAGLIESSPSPISNTALPGSVTIEASDAFGAQNRPDADAPLVEAAIETAREPITFTAAPNIPSSLGDSELPSDDVLAGLVDIGDLKTFGDTGDLGDFTVSGFNVLSTTQADVTTPLNGQETAPELLSHGNGNSTPTDVGENAIPSTESFSMDGSTAP